MNARRPTVKEPPREGNAACARYHLKDGWELIGWTNSAEEAYEWADGFGPGTPVHVEDQHQFVRGRSITPDR